MPNKDQVSHIIQARSGLQLAIEVLINADQEIIEKHGDEMVNIVFEHYVNVDHSLGGEKAISNKPSMELYYRDMNGRIQIFNGKRKGFFDRVVKLSVDVTPRENK